MTGSPPGNSVALSPPLPDYSLSLSIFLPHHVSPRHGAPKLQKAEARILVSLSRVATQPLSYWPRRSFVVIASYDNGALVGLDCQHHLTLRRPSNHTPSPPILPFSHCPLCPASL